jgi:hypothetical protein
VDCRAAAPAQGRFQAGFLGTHDRIAPVEVSRLLPHTVPERRCRRLGQASGSDEATRSFAAKASVSSRRGGRVLSPSRRGNEPRPATEQRSPNRRTPQTPAAKAFRQSPLTDSNRRPLPYHGGSRARRRGTSARLRASKGLLIAGFWESDGCTSERAQNRAKRTWWPPDGTREPVTASPAVPIASTWMGRSGRWRVGTWCELPALGVVGAGHGRTRHESGRGPRGGISGRPSLAGKCRPGAAGRLEYRDGLGGVDVLLACRPSGRRGVGVELPNAPWRRIAVLRHAGGSPRRAHPRRCDEVSAGAQYVGALVGVRGDDASRC